MGSGAALPVADGGPASASALVVRPIGVIRSPYLSRDRVPQDPFATDRTSTLVVFDRFVAAIAGLAVGDDLFVVWWAHGADRSRLTRDSGSERGVVGVLASRAPDRPNPVGLSRATVTGIGPNVIGVTGMDAVDGSPIIDLKPVVRTSDGRPA